jgi:hypothetical protein
MEIVKNVNFNPDHLISDFILIKKVSFFLQLHNVLAHTT